MLRPHFPRLKKIEIEIANFGNWNVFLRYEQAQILKGEADQRVLKESISKIFKGLFSNPELLEAQGKIYLSENYCFGIQSLVCIDDEKKEVAFFSARAYEEIQSYRFNQHQIELIRGDEKLRKDWDQFSLLVEKVINHQYWTKSEKNSFESNKSIFNINKGIYPELGIYKVTNLYGLAPLFFGPDQKEWGLVGHADFMKKKVELASFVNSYKRSIFESLTDFMLSLTALYPILRIYLLKLVAVLPSLDHDESGKLVKNLFIENMIAIKEEAKKDCKILPGFYLFCIKALLGASKLIPAKIFANIFRFSVSKVAQRFIAGQDIASAKNTFHELSGTNRQATLDYLGELVVSEKEAVSYFSTVLEMITDLGKMEIKGKKNQAGIYYAHISIKISALCSDFRAIAKEEVTAKILPRLTKILLTAKKNQVFINIDAEHYSQRDLVFEIYKKSLLSEPKLHDYSATGIVLQAYLRDGYQHFLDILTFAKKRKLVMPIRLVKGAYWDAETTEAFAHSYEAPEFLNKVETDIHFRQLIIELLKNSPHVQLCLASHNDEDHCYGEVLRQTKFPTSLPIEHQCLHQTYEALSMALAKMGWVVRNYVPIGPLLTGMSYLVRRIMENSSQVGVLAQKRLGPKENDQVRNLGEILEETVANGDYVFDESSNKLDGDFFNCAPMRPYLQQHYDKFLEEKNNFEKKYLGEFYQNTSAENLKGEEVKITSAMDESVIVGRICFATKKEAAKIIEGSYTLFEKGDWPRAEQEVRSSYLFSWASKLLMKRDYMAILICYEGGKNIEEAYADVDEAIDFLNFYGKSSKNLLDQNSSLVPRGVMSVISPWNFPLAIACGMCAGALVAGNIVILKSSQQTPLVVQKLVDLFYETGITEKCLIHLPGKGSELGDVLANHEMIAGVVFTGSKKIGMQIFHSLHQRTLKHPHLDKVFLPKVITEMGGKNAIIVTDTAELDETLSGILYSTFAHAGQKCSACSRVLVAKSVLKEFLKRFISAAKDLNMGDPLDEGTYINPLISAGEKKRFLKELEYAKKEVQDFSGKIHLDRSLEAGDEGALVGPVVLELGAKRAMEKGSYAQHEFFAPLCHIIPFEGLDEAIEIFNSTEYALTGGMFSQSQNQIDYLLDRLECGNIYVNRGCTGARVAIEPFGGFKLSGTGPKAGHHDYLKAFYVHGNLDGAKVKYEEKLKANDELSLYHRPIKARENKFYFEEKIQIIEKLMTELDSSFFSQESGEKFLYYLRNYSLKFILDAELNRTIAGQYNYNDHLLGLQKVIVVACFGKVSEELIFELFSCYILGISFDIYLLEELNDIEISWWTPFLKLGENFKVVKTSRKSFMQHPPKDWDLGVYSCEINFTLLMNEYFFASEKNLVPVSIGPGQELRRVFLESELPKSTGIDFDEFFLSLTRTRSMAINTMRHGAPLEYTN